MSKELYEAAKNGNLDEVKRLLTLPGANINILAGANNLTPIHIATLRKHISVITFLARQTGINVDHSIDMDTPLMAAVQRKQVDIINILLPYSNMTLVNSNFLTPYFQSKQLLQTAKTPDEKQAYQQILDLLRNPTLQSAADHGDENLLKTMLLTERAEVNSVNHNGMSALMLAARKGRVEIVDFLLSCPWIQVNLSPAKGQSALLSSLLGEQAPTERGALADYQNRCLGRLKVAAHLIQKGADVNQTYNDGSRLTAVMALLKRHNANLDFCLEVLNAMVATKKLDVTVPYPRFKVELRNGVPTSIPLEDGTILDLIKELPNHAQGPIQAIIEPLFKEQMAKKKPQNPQIVISAPIPPLSTREQGLAQLLLPRATTIQERKQVISTIEKTTGRPSQTFFTAPAAPQPDPTHRRIYATANGSAPAPVNNTASTARN